MYHYRHQIYSMQAGKVLHNFVKILQNYGGKLSFLG